MSKNNPLVSVNCTVDYDFLTKFLLHEQNLPIISDEWHLEITLKSV